MATTLSSSSQAAKNQIKVWLEDLQDENSIMRLVSFFRNDILPKNEPILKPMTEQELKDKIEKSLNSKKSYTMEEARAKIDDALKPMTDEEYYQKVKKAIDSADNGRVISTAELRERAKTW
jgi:predicted RNase H-like HicB family nuclease